MKKQALLLMFFSGITASTFAAQDHNTNSQHHPLQRQEGQPHLDLHPQTPHAAHVDIDPEWSRRSTLIQSPNQQAETSHADPVPPRIPADPDQSIQIAMAFFAAAASNASQQSNTPDSAQWPKVTRKKSTETAVPQTGRNRLGAVANTTHNTAPSVSTSISTQQELPALSSSSSSSSSSHSQPSAASLSTNSEPLPSASSSSSSSSSSPTGTTYRVTPSPLRVLVDTGTSLNGLYDPNSQHHLTAAQKLLVQKLLIGTGCACAGAAALIGYGVGRCHKRT